MLDGHAGQNDGDGNPIPPPQEWVDYALMTGMRWSWSEISGLEGEVPWYVQRYCMDFMQMSRKAQEEKWQHG